MKDETRNLYRDLPWGAPASLALHALLIALMVYGLPRTSQQPGQEQAINVALVPSPEQREPELDPVPPPKKPEAEKVPQPQAEKPPTPESQPRQPSPIEVLKPVFQFGDKDAGPEKSPDGDSADGDRSPATAKEAGAREDAAEPEAGKQAEAAAPTPSADDASDQVALPMAVRAPEPRPANVSRPAGKSSGGQSPAEVAAAPSPRYSGLPGVRKLYAQGATGDAVATTASDGVPRGQRAARLCASALQRHLVQASYTPDLVPLVPLKTGNVLDVPETAFRTQATWYRLGFRCEVDSDATHVLSFDFRAGAPIPSDEWASLGLPAR